MKKIIVFAGPNGSGKSTVINAIREQTDVKNYLYVNADDIANVFFANEPDYNNRNLMAAKYAEYLRNKYIDEGKDFMFETVLSTERNINLLRRAKQDGYFITGVYVLTRDSEINVERVKNRVLNGGHDVPEDKIRARYDRCLSLIPDFVGTIDNMVLYDNTDNILLTLLKKDRDITVVTNQIQAPDWFDDNILNPIKEKGYNFLFVKKNYNKESLFNLQEVLKQGEQEKI